DRRRDAVGRAAAGAREIGVVAATLALAILAPGLPVTRPLRHRHRITMADEPFRHRVEIRRFQQAAALRVLGRAVVDDDEGVRAGTRWTEDRCAHHDDGWRRWDEPELLAKPAGLQPMRSRKRLTAWHEGHTHQENDK